MLMLASLGSGVAGAMSLNDFYSANDINFYDKNASASGSACGGSDLSGSAPASLTGASNEEKVWNYFNARGLSDVAIAGVMGNIAQESGFDPFKHEAGGGGGWGLIQWTPATAFDGNKVADTPATVVAGASSGDNDLYLLWELNAVWNRGGDGFWQKLNTEASVGDRATIEALPYGQVYNKDAEGKGSTLVFHNKVVISGDYNTDPIPSGHGDFRKRVDAASGYLAKYGGTGCKTSDGIKAVSIAKAELDAWNSGQQQSSSKYGAGSGVPWCGYFAGWVMTQAGSAAAQYVDPSVPTIVDNAKAGKGGMVWHLAGEGYVPQPGDLTVESWNGQTMSHVNIYIGGGQIIGGNQEGAVTQRGAMNTYGYVQMP